MTSTGEEAFAVMIDEGMVGATMELCAIARSVEEAEAVAARICATRFLGGRVLRIMAFQFGVPAYPFPPINGASPKLISTLPLRRAGPR